MKKLILIPVFCIAAAGAVFLRFYQMIALTEYQTGFMKREDSFAYIMLSVIIGLLVLAAPVFALLLRPVPKKSRSFNAMLSLSSILLGGACAFDVSFLSVAGGDVPVFLKILYVASGALCAAYFAAAGVRSFLYFPFSAKLSVIPPAFFTVRAACVFISCSRYAVISDTVFEVFVYCASMLLFLEIARAANGTGSKSGTKKTAFLGLAVSVLAFSHALPRIALGIFGSAALHDSALGSVLTLALGIYTASLVFARIDFSGVRGKKLGVYYTGRH